MLGLLSIQQRGNQQGAHLHSQELGPHHMLGAHYVIPDGGLQHDEDNMHSMKEGRLSLRPLHDQLTTMKSYTVMIISVLYEGLMLMSSKPSFHTSVWLKKSPVLSS